MKTVEAFECVDNKLFTDKRKAQEHEADLLGQEVEKLLKLYELDTPRHREVKGCLAVLDKRQALLACAWEIIGILTHCEEN